jgi:hypothetical protein
MEGALRRFREYNNNVLRLDPRHGDHALDDGEMEWDKMMGYRFPRVFDM